MLSRDNIRQAMAEGHLRIFPFEEKNLTGIGYNISNNKGRCELLVSHFAKPSSEKFRERHLELKKFVQDELADSLNGYDSFLGPDQPQDRYSSKVQRLQILHERLERDRLLISEDRYKLGTQGI